MEGGQLSGLSPSLTSVRVTSWLSFSPRAIPDTCPPRWSTALQASPGAGWSASARRPGASLRSRGQAGQPLHPVVRAASFCGRSRPKLPGLRVSATVSSCCSRAGTLRSLYRRGKTGSGARRRSRGRARVRAESSRLLAAGHGKPTPSGPQGAALMLATAVMGPWDEEPPYPRSACRRRGWGASAHRLPGAGEQVLGPTELRSRLSRATGDTGLRPPSLGTHMSGEGPGPCSAAGEGTAGGDILKAFSTEPGVAESLNR